MPLVENMAKNTENRKINCLRQVRLTENLPRATHTKLKLKLRNYFLKHALHTLDDLCVCVCVFYIYVVTMSKKISSQNFDF